VAEFEAVVSGDIYVLAPKDNQRLLPELLPFLCLSERFFQHAVGTSAGSLSPRTNWSSLASFEFDLPPLDQQRRIAEILWAVDESEQSRWSLKGDLETLKLAYEVAEFDKLFDAVSEGQIKAAKLRNVLITPICNGIFKTSDLFGKGTLLVNVTDIYSGFRAVPSSLNRVEVTQSESQRFSANPGDVIFNRSSLVLTGIGHACLVPEWDEDMVFECHLMRARPDPLIIDSRFMCRYALSPRGRRFLMSRAQTTTMTTINQGDIGDMPFPLPDLERQRAIADHLDDLESTIADVNRAIASDALLKSKFANQLFS
jgi:type I restriction enzyme S subunit